MNKKNVTHKSELKLFHSSFFFMWQKKSSKRTRHGLNLDFGNFSLFNCKTNSIILSLDDKVLPSKLSVRRVHQKFSNKLRNRILNRFSQFFSRVYTHSCKSSEVTGFTSICSLIFCLIWWNYDWTFELLIDTKHLSSRPYDYSIKSNEKSFLQKSRTTLIHRL